MLALGTVHFSSGELEDRGRCERRAGIRDEAMNRDWAKGGSRWDQRCERQ